MSHPPPPTVQVDLDRAVPHITIAGELDWSNVATLRTPLEHLVHLGHSRIELDVAAVTFLDSSVLRLVADVRGGGCELEVLRPSPLVRRLLELVAPAPRSQVAAEG
jgi:anti-anti-sigma factor